MPRLWSLCMLLVRVHPRAQTPYQMSLLLTLMSRTRRSINCQFLSLLWRRRTLAASLCWLQCIWFGSAWCCKAYNFQTAGCALFYWADPCQDQTIAWLVDKMFRFSRCCFSILKWRQWEWMALVMWQLVEGLRRCLCLSFLNKNYQVWQADQCYRLDPSNILFFLGLFTCYSWFQRRLPYREYFIQHFLHSRIWFHFPVNFQWNLQIWGYEIPMLSNLAVPAHKILEF